MTPEEVRIDTIAIRQQLAAAEQSAADWRRRAEHAEAQIGLATVRMQQAEQTMRGMVELRLGRCDCENCEHRERVMG